MNEDRYPNQDYESTQGVYGGKIKTEADGKIVWDNRGLVSKIDKWGDAILRTYDEHVVKDLGEMIRRHPKLFFQFIAPGPKRYRGSKEEIFENIQRLGLENTYDIHEHGIEIKDRDLALHGVPMQDIFRSDLIDSEKVKGFDRFEAIETASKFIKEVHNNVGGVGELNIFHIIFKNNEDGKLGEPNLSIPDIVFNKDKNISEKEKKATDILDFITTIGAEEFRASEGDLMSVKKAMKIALENYGDLEVVSLVKSYIKRGRLTMLGDKDSSAVNLPAETFTTKHRGLFTKHNEARIVNNRGIETSLKDIGLEVCEELTTKY
jgi:hypothetical protein